MRARSGEAPFCCPALPPPWWWCPLLLQLLFVDCASADDAEVATVMVLLLLLLLFDDDDAGDDPRVSTSCMLIFKYSLRKKTFMAPRSPTQRPNMSKAHQSPTHK